MKCPFCNKVMEKGFIQGARGVIFSPDEKILFVTRKPFNKKDISITDSIFETASPANYCYDCDCLVWKKSSEEMT